MEEKEIIRNMVNNYNEVIDTGTVPSEWKQSNTKMIPKKRRPTPKDLRPIALTNVNYKIFMSIVKDKIEKHLIRYSLNSETQAGFTAGRRIEDNIFILDYCVKSSFKMKKSLVVAAIDFAKAFDSIRRDRMMQIMKEYRINKEILNVIAEIYDGDTTQLIMSEDVED
jgi:hypothetical protein